MTFIRTVFPSGRVSEGACTRCDGHGELKMQCMAGEVRWVDCSRCLGTGDEPAGWWEKLKAAFRMEVYP